MQQTNRSVNRSTANHELIISGVPYVTEENLEQVFHHIAVALGYTPTNIPIVYLKRLSRTPINVGSSPLILCQFALRGVRDEFYGKYLRQRSLNLRHVGFNNANRIYINENLTLDDRSIRKEAIKLKTQGRIAQVFTRSGAVFVRVKQGDEAELCSSLDQLFETVN